MSLAADCKQAQAEAIACRLNYVLHTAITRQGVTFLWPVRLPELEDRPNAWHVSMAAAAELAMEFWVRVASNRAMGEYEIKRATGGIPDPVWRKEPFDELVRLAFKDHLIASVDHPMVARLRGLK